MTTPSLKHTSEGDVYEVFARFREKELHHIGSVIARDDDLAQMYAAKLYDEWGWREMAIVRRAAIVPIVGPL